MSAKADGQREVAASAAPTMAPSSFDFKLSRIADQQGEEHISEAQNFDLQMPDMSKVKPQPLLQFQNIDLERVTGYFYSQDLLS